MHSICDSTVSKNFFILFFICIYTIYICIYMYINIYISIFMYYIYIHMYYILNSPTLYSSKLCGIDIVEVFQG